MAIFILQPDAQGTCCDCAGRTEPCDTCGGGCAVCVTECTRTGTRDISGVTIVCPAVPFTDNQCTSYNSHYPCPGGGTAVQTAQAQVRLVITELTANVETHAFVFFSNNTSHEFVFTPTSASYTTEYVNVPMPVLDAVGISVTGCTVSCPNVECALTIPALSSPYANLADAQAGIAQRVSNCIGYIAGSATITSFSATNPSTTQLVLAGGLMSNTVRMYVSITVGPGTTNLTVPFSFALATTPASPTASIELFRPESEIVLMSDTVSAFNGTLHLLSIPAGTYVISVFCSGLATTPLSVSGTFTLNSSVAMIVNPVIALYSDSGTKQLQACPKMLLPPISEGAGGSWYVNLAAAQAVLSNPLRVSGCVGYSTGNISAPFTSFSATGSGGSLRFTAGGFNPIFGSNTGSMEGSLNITAGSTITASTSGNFIQLYIYDENGSVIFNQNVSSSSISSDPIPNTGKYTIIVISAATPFVSSITVNVSGGTSTNLIQALYDIGLDCPARLNCS